MIKILEKVFSKNKYENYTIDEYDEKFGVPTTEVWDICDLLNFLDNIISDIEHSNKQFTENLNSKYNLKVDRVVATALFEKGIKELYKKHREDIIKEVKETIIKLGNYEITTQKDNHPLTNLQGHLDIHFDGKRYILLYKYISSEVLMVGIDNVTFQNILKLQDFIKHDKINRYDKRKFKSNTKEFDIDKLDKKE